MNDKKIILNKKGITLFISVLLIVILSIIVVGLTTFVIQRLSIAQTKFTLAKAVYLAQAGIHNAIYNYRQSDLGGNGSFALGQTNIDADHFYVTGGDDGDFLMVDTSQAVLVANNRIRRVRLQNANNTRNIAIDRLVVTWNNPTNIRRFVIAGCRAWSGNLPSPANLNLQRDCVFNTAPQVRNLSLIRFNGNMNGDTVTVQFIMTDGTTRTQTVYPESNNFNFTVKATGKTANSVLYKTIQADYNALTGRIYNYDEINTEILP